MIIEIVLFHDDESLLFCIKFIYIWQWFSDKNLSVTYDDITVSATCTSDDTETQQYDIFIQQHEANDSEYANVSSVNVSTQH